MYKNKRRHQNILFILAGILILLFTACDNDNDSSSDDIGIFTLLGIPSEFDGKYVDLGNYLSDTNKDFLIGGFNYDGYTFSRVRISKGVAKIPLWVNYTPFNSYVNWEKYSHSETLSHVIISIYDSDYDDFGPPHMGSLFFYSVNFLNGNTTKLFIEGMFEYLDIN